MPPVVIVLTICFRFLMILPGPVNILNMSGRPGRGYARVLVPVRSQTPDRPASGLVQLWLAEPFCSRCQSSSRASCDASC
jgi:hypothetical protein